MKYARVLSFLLVLFLLLGILGLLLSLGILKSFGALVIASWSPNLAAVIALGIIHGDGAGIRDLLKRWITWRIPLSS